MLLLLLLSGASFGSFAYELIICAHQDRPLPWRSRCSFCQTKLRPYDLVPLLSYWWLKGQCRYCHCPLTPSYWQTEIFFALALLFYAHNELAQAYGLGFFLYLFFCSYADLLYQEFYPCYFYFFLLFLYWKVPACPNFYFTLSCVLLCFFLILWNKEHYFGSGDLYIFALMSTQLSPIQSIWLLFWAANFGLLYFLCFQKRQIPFIPCLTLSLYFLQALSL